MRKEYSIVKWFIVSAVIIFIITAMAKLASIFGSSKALNERDPLFGISFRHLMLAVGLIELGVGAACWLVKNQTLKLCLVAWLSTNFIIYRVGLWFLGWHYPCPCLGSMTEMLHIRQATADLALIVILSYLTICSYAAIVFRHVQYKRCYLN